jgi:predicted dehydrogenase
MSSFRSALRTVVVGCGYAGDRFLRALNYGRCSELYQVVALVDRDPGKLIRGADGAATYHDLDLALHRESPDIVVACVNEESHFAVLDAVLDAPSVLHVACEKPLTRTMEEFRLLAPELRGVPVSVNFCERYSPIIDECVRWLADRHASIVRVEFFWGKYRVRDPRPTMGVLSELSHPLDLVRYLLGWPQEAPLQLTSVTSTRSDFSLVDDVMDGVSLVGSIGDTLLMGSSSFVWEERRRRLILFARDSTDGRVWQLVLDFDNPVWDNDTFTAYELNPETGQRVEVERIAYGASDIPEAVRHVWKIHRYLLDVADGIVGNRTHARYAGLHDARWVQTALDDISQQERGADRHRCTSLFADQTALARNRGIPA